MEVMFSDLPSSTNRRSFGRTALMGAASAFLAADVAAGQEGEAHEIIDARKFGAVAVREGVTLTGVAGWNYSFGAGSVLRLVGMDSACLLDLTDARGATVQGLVLDGGALGQGIDGIRDETHGLWKA
jgi:hypothetical protein